MLALPGRRDLRWSFPRDVLNAVFHVFSSGVAAALVGTTLGLAGGLLAGPEAPQTVIATGVVAFALSILATLELLGFERSWWPQSPWGIPPRWYGYGATRYAVGSGLTLGTGMLTRVPFIGTYVLYMCCVALGSPLWGASVMAIFGVTRASAVLAAPLRTWARRQAYSAAQVESVGAAITRLAEHLRLAKAMALLLLAASVVGTW